MTSTQHHAATQTAGGYRVRPHFQVTWYTKTIQHDSVTGAYAFLQACRPCSVATTLAAGQCLET